MGPAHIILHLLGGFHLNGGQFLGGLNLRHQLLIAYLALRAPHAISRAEIAFKLWADSTEEQALTNLRKALHHIKQQTEDGEIIQADARTLQLNPGLHLDVADFTSALDAAERARLANDPQTEQTALETATAFYRGDLLPSLYDEWLIPERERLRGQFLRAMDRLIVLYETRQHYRDAIQHAQRLLQTDNLREETYRTLIRLHALNNDRAAALNTYHTCAGTLAKELGVEPDADTRELYERLLKSDTRLSRSTPTRPVSTPLVAREAEWKTLLTQWKKTAQGEFRTVLLSGEAGIGKTRLAEDFMHWAARQGIHTAAAACYSVEGRISFAPVADWLRAMPLDDLDSRSRAELARILPELRGDAPSPSMTENWQRQVFFEALARGVLNTAEPTVLLLDDIQWCDNDTLAWLRYFLHFDRKAPVLVLVTLRAEELPANNELQLLLVDQRAEGRITELELNRLNESQTAELGKHLLGNSFSMPDASVLFRESEGVPLFVVELANAGVRVESARGTEAGTGAKEAGLPPRLKAVLEGRLARLSSPARAVIESAAVIGREFDFELLRTLSDIDEGAAVYALDELWRLRMVRERGGRYDFSHDKLREATLAGISPMRLRWLHQRIGETLETERAGTEYSRIADHFERAGQAAKACVYYVRAAGQAQQVFAFTEALGQLRNAILLETQHTALADLHEQRGDVLKMIERREDAVQAYVQAHHLSADDLQKARLNRKQSTLVGRFELGLAREKYEATLAELSRAQTSPGYWSEWIDTQLAWIEICYWKQNAAEINTLMEQVREPIERHGTLLQKIQYRYRLISSAFINERYHLNAAHVALAQETIELAIESGDPYHLSNAKRQFGMVAMCAGQVEVAESAYREALSLCKKNGDINSMLIARVYLSQVHRRQHKPQDVRADTDLLEEQLAQVSPNPAYRGVALSNRAWLVYQDGNLVATRALAESALAAWHALENIYPMQWLASLLLLAVAVAEEKTDEASTCVQALLAPKQMRLPPDLESALQATLEAGTKNKKQFLARCKKAVDIAKTAGYL